MSARHTGVDTVPLARVVAVALIGLLAMGMGWLLWPPAGGGALRAARATVVQSAVCAPPDGPAEGSSGVLSDPRDVVRVELPDDRAVLARLDGCGHRLSEVITVEVPDPLPQGEVLARLAGTGVAAAKATGRRLDAVGAAVASLGGALMVWWLRGGWGAPARRVAP